LRSLRLSRLSSLRRLHRKTPVHNRHRSPRINQVLSQVLSP
jgi:hypothetical protein